MHDLLVLVLATLVAWARAARVTHKPHVVYSAPAVPGDPPFALSGPKVE